VSVLVMLGIQLRVLGMLGKCSATELGKVDLRVS
jgi:hypothetical protein